MDDGQATEAYLCYKFTNEPSAEPKMACAPSKDSDQPGHPPSLIRGFAAHMKKLGFLATH